MHLINVQFVARLNYWVWVDSFSFTVSLWSAELLCAYLGRTILLYPYVVGGNSFHATVFMKKDLEWKHVWLSPGDSQPLAKKQTAFDF